MMAAGATAHVEQRIVRHHGADADHHGVDLGAQAMDMIEGGIAVDPAAFAGRRRNSPVERLAKLRHHERPVGRRVADGIITGDEGRHWCLVPNELAVIA